MFLYFLFFLYFVYFLDVLNVWNVWNCWVFWIFSFFGFSANELFLKRIVFELSVIRICIDRENMWSNSQDDALL